MDQKISACHRGVNIIGGQQNVCVCVYVRVVGGGEARRRERSLYNHLKWEAEVIRVLDADPNGWPDCGHGVIAALALCG